MQVGTLCVDPLQARPSVVGGEAGMTKHAPLMYSYHRAYKHTYLDLLSERARLASPWPLRSSQLNTASVYYLRDRSSFYLLSSTLFCTSFMSISFFSFLCFLHFFVLAVTRVLVFSYVYVSSVSSCTRAAVVATPQPTAIQQHHNDNSSRYTCLLYTSPSPRD